MSISICANTSVTQVFVEPGTPIGFRVIRGARNVVLEMKTDDKNTNPNVLAPCPHNISCPQPLDSWCHFIQRVERTSLLRTAKQASINWENEKFSFVAIMKGPLPVQQAAADPTSPNYGLEESRLIRQPLKRGGHILVDVCKPEGSFRLISTPPPSWLETSVYHHV
jgi:ribosomal protein RSM22 (predicted rRNA methylase)